MKLLIGAILKYLFGVLIVGLLLFIPGGLDYRNGWIFMGLLFIPMFIAGLIMFFKNPDLLKRRLEAKESEDEQKIVILISGIMFIVGFLIAGLNYRYNWYIMPDIIVFCSSILFVISYCLYGVVLIENSYLSRTIKVEKNQKVVDTGMYAVVRHPMYSITIILFLMIPLILNSIISFFIFLVYPVVIVIRLLNEEKVLAKDLDGYKEYMKKVKYRLIPFIW